MTDYEANRNHMIQKNREILSSLLEEGPEPASQKPVAQEQDRPRDVVAFTSMEDIQLSAERVQQMLEHVSPLSLRATADIPLGATETAGQREEGIPEIDVYSILDFGGPCRHTRSARRELTDFLVNEKADYMTPAPKKIKTDEAPPSEDAF